MFIQSRFEIRDSQQDIGFAIVFPKIWPAISITMEVMILYMVVRKDLGILRV